MKYLLSISIGPVQDFIATARRSRDLWFGSWLLSEISKAAANRIAGSDLQRLIFPAANDAKDLEPVEHNADGSHASGSEFSVVNKLVAVIHGDPGQCCAEVVKAMNARLERIRVQAYSPSRVDKSLIDEVAARQQVADLVEFYWAAYPLNNPEDAAEYKRAREAVEALLAARKNLRNFEAVSWSIKWKPDNRVPKSSLDGQRESVIDDSIYGRLSKEQLRKKLGVREGERLCGVGLLKRHGNRKGDGSFFSTSHVAAGPLLEKMERLDAAHRNVAKTAANAYVRRLAELLWTNDSQLVSQLKNSSGELPSALKKKLNEEIGFVPERAAKKEHEIFGRWDGHLLFEERLKEFFEDKTAEGKKQLDEARKALKIFLEQAVEGERPKPYYALIHADGDFMGAAIDAQPNKKSHRDLSTKLSEFAKSVRDIVESGEHKGSLVYSGGDDVLAFLPLHTTLHCARVLANKFSRELSGFAFDDNGRSHRPSLSVGIAVGHHLDPLQDILDLAREAEKIAKKQVPGKNALAIIVSKRSGADWTVKGSWRADAPGGALEHRLNRLIHLPLDEQLPRGIGYELRDLSLRLRGLDVPVRAEALRILQRKRNQRGEKLSTTKAFEDVAAWVRNAEIKIEDLAYELIVSRLFASAVKQSGLDARAFDEYCRKGLEADARALTSDDGMSPEAGGEEV